MELIEAIKSRKSIRGYKPTPIPKEILKEILEIAIRAPSGVNSQPWEFTVLGGKPLDDLKQALQEKSLAGVEPHHDFPREPLTGVYKKRQSDLAVSMFQLMGIAREDTEKRSQWSLKGLRLFDAPNAIIISMDKEISNNYMGMFGLGSVTQTIALAAMDYGLGTCIQGAIAYYPEIVRRIACIAESKKLVVGMAIGYPDWGSPANKLQSTREPLADVVTWQGVEHLTGKS